jgi:hypothetical protein
LYYNPGGLAGARQSAVSLSGTGYQFDLITVESLRSEGLNFRSGQVFAVPLMAAGVKRWARHPRHTLGYGVLTRQQVRVRIDEQADELTDAIPEEPGLEDYSGQINFQLSLTELWGGVAYAYQLHPKWSVGVTGFVAYRNQDLNINQEAVAAYGRQGWAESTEQLEALSNHLRLLWKAGLYGQVGQWRLGLVFTTPSVGLYGWARSGSRLERRYTPSQTGAPSRPDILGRAYDRYATSDYRSPWSLALGLGRTFGRCLLATAVEFYDRVAPYELISADNTAFFRTNSLPNQGSIPPSEFLTAYQGAGRVLNVVLGTEIRLWERGYLLASGRTDFAARETGRDARPFSFALSRANWDTYHATLGLRIVRERSDFSVGFKYSTGKLGQRLELRNLSNPSVNTSLFGTPQQLGLNFDSFALIVGSTVRFR